MRVEGRDAEGIVEELPQTSETLEEVVQNPMKKEEVFSQLLEGQVLDREEESFAETEEDCGD